MPRLRLFAPRQASNVGFAVQAGAYQGEFVPQGLADFLDALLVRQPAPE